MSGHFNHSQTADFSGWVALIAAVFCGLALMGCSAKQTPSYPFTNLTGTVSVDGKPLRQGYLQFVPSGKQRGTVVSAKIVKGKYIAKWIPLGKVSVVVLATKTTGKMLDGYSQPIPEVISLIADKYRKGIEIAVDDHLQSQNFNLVPIQ